MECPGSSSSSAKSSSSSSCFAETSCRSFDDYSASYLVRNAAVNFAAACVYTVGCIVAALSQVVDFGHSSQLLPQNFRRQPVRVCDLDELCVLLCVRNSVLAYQMLVWQLEG